MKALHLVQHTTRSRRKIIDVPQSKVDSYPCQCDKSTQLIAVYPSLVSGVES